jgi:opacity protein-like surface antigen
MRNSSIVFAGLLALICTDAALAQVAANTGFYVGLGLGKSHARFKTADFTTGDPSISESPNTTDTGYKALIGWSFSRYFATELSYTSIGRYRYSYSQVGTGSGNVTYDANAVALSALGAIPLAKDWSVLLRLGVSANKAERSGLNGDFSTAPMVVGSASKTRASPMGGLGLQYDFTQRAALRLEMEYYGQFGEQKGAGVQVTPTANFPDTTGRAAIWMFSIGGVARF